MKQGQTTFPRNQGRTTISLLSALLVASCSSGPPPADWQLGAASSLAAFQKHYLEGDSKLAEIEFALAKAEIRKTGRPDLLARAELLRCAARVASLEMDDCPGFEALKRDAGPEELAYAEYLAGRGKHSSTEDAISRLVAFGVQFRSGSIAPAGIVSAIDVASAQGWRRPLLAWLEVEAKRAEAAGDQNAAQRARRRVSLILEGK